VSHHLITTYARECLEGEVQSSSDSRRVLEDATAPEVEAGLSSRLA
jgi:hypothetical protein